MYRKDTWANAKAVRSQGMSYNDLLTDNSLLKLLCWRLLSDP